MSKYNNLKIIDTLDQSKTVIRLDIDEAYHSCRGAVSESKYVYIKQGLGYLNKSKINLLEVGFGTGLNTWLTYLYAESEKIKINYVSLEPFPLEKDIYRDLNYTSKSNELKFLLIHELQWGIKNQFSDYFQLQKLQTTLEAFERQDLFDLIYFDAFAPSKQPDIWDINNIQKCFGSMNPGGILVTYSAQGQFKRNLLQCGFQIESLPGALGKKEMIRAVK